MSCDPVVRVPADRRVLLDLDRHRAVVRGARLVGPSSAVPIDQVILDTGCNVGVLAPLAAVAPLVGDDAWGDRIQGFGGQVATTGFKADLQLGPWLLPDVEVHASAGFLGWYVGLPVLKHFHLLLRHDEDLPAGPCLVGPDPLSFNARGGVQI